jgi:hypothetical protein
MGNAIIEPAPQRLTYVLIFRCRIIVRVHHRQCIAHIYIIEKESPHYGEELREPHDLEGLIDSRTCTASAILGRFAGTCTLP